MIKEGKQPDWPEDMFDLRMYALVWDCVYDKHLDHAFGSLPCRALVVVKSYLMFYLVLSSSITSISFIMPG